jgi:hypothetical protein
VINRWSNELNGTQSFTVTVHGEQWRKSEGYYPKNEMKWNQMKWNEKWK